MRSKRDAHIYASALYPFIAAEFPAAVSAIEAVLIVFQQVPELVYFFRHPSFSGEEKKKLFHAFFEKLFEHTVSGVLERLMDLLILKRKLSTLPVVLEELKALRLLRQNLEEARIYSAYALSEAEQAAIADDISSALRKEIMPVFAVQPSLIGGVKVTIHDWVFDYSLQGQLQAVAQYLHGAG